MTVETKYNDFETALKDLEDIVAKLEKGDLPLEKALELFEEGVKISRFCNSKLEEAERKVEILVKDQSGHITVKAFEVDVQVAGGEEG